MRTLLLTMALALNPFSSAKANVLYKAEESTPVEAQAVAPPQVTQEKEKPSRAKKPTTLTNKSENLSSRNWSMIGEGQITIISQSASDKSDDFKLGQILTATIPMSVMAFTDGKAPVVADVHFESGPSYRMLGEATVEKNSKRIAIEFKKVSNSEGTKIFDIKAQALDQDGTYGLMGEVHTGEGKYFLAELLSAAAAGFADASIKRSTNALGNPVDDQSLDTQGKKAVVSALNKSGEHFAEKLKQTTEYVTVDGPLRVKVIVVEGTRTK